MLSPGPSRSPGRKAEGVLRCGSGGGSPHKELPPLLVGGQPVFQVSLPPPRPQPPPLPLCALRCCSRDCTSESPNISAKIVVLLNTQLFKAPCACNTHTFSYISTNKAINSNVTTNQLQNSMVAALILLKLSWTLCKKKVKFNNNL